MTPRGNVESLSRNVAMGCLPGPRGVGWGPHRHVAAQGWAGSALSTPRHVAAHGTGSVVRRSSSALDADRGRLGTPTLVDVAEGGAGLRSARTAVAAAPVARTTASSAAVVRREASRSSGARLTSTGRR